MTACVLLAALLAADPNDAIVPPGAKVEKVWGEGEFTEGPVYGPDRRIYFSDIGNRIMAYDPKSGKTYASKLRVASDGTLKVSGCIAMFCQTQTWTKAS